MYASPEDLANVVSAELSARAIESVSRDALAELFHVLFGASLRTEEGQPITAQVAVVDPENPDPDPPARIVADRWWAVRLGEPVPLSIASLTKLAGAADPRSTWLVAYTAKDGSLIVWGLIDQSHAFYDYVNFDSQLGRESPGVHVRIEGPGHLTVWIGYDKIGELRTNELVSLPVDALDSGAAFDALEGGIARHIERVADEVGDIAFDDRPWQEALKSDWIASLCRVLLRARNFRHGGAFLLTPTIDY